MKKDMKGVRLVRKLRNFFLIIVIIISSFGLVGCEYFIKEPPVEEPQIEEPEVEVNDKYTVRWENYDGTLLETTNNLSKDEIPEYLGKTPEKESTKEFDYIFIGWSPKIRPVDGNIIYAAEFREVRRKYEITWLNSDGTMLSKVNVEYGMMPHFNGLQPSKASTFNYDFEFVGWYPALKPVIENAQYTAEFYEVLRKYDITWKDSDGTLLDVVSVEYGKMPSYNLPPGTTEWQYIGWDPEITSVGENKEYTATRVKKEYTVSFYLENNSLIQRKTLPYGSEITCDIAVPNKLNHVFEGWFTLEGNKVYPNETVDKNLNLYARYALDYVSLINYIQQETIKANVKIEAESYNTGFMGMKTDSFTSLGSGVIFMEYGGYYYVLTNNHVAARQEGFSYISYSISDYKGVKYEAQIYNNALDPNYDLAVLIFAKDKDLYVLELATENPEVGEEVISLGQPGGQLNAVTFGEVVRYAIVYFQTPIPDSTVEFLTITHNAPIKGGSSGGALINTNLNLVGVNFASSVDETINEGSAIPIEKVFEFLNQHGWNFPV
jgi:S1-C subfamily serine protease